MSSPIVVPLAETNIGALRRTATDRAVSASKRDTDRKDGLVEGPGLLKRAVTANAERRSPTLVRKKLPWLDNAQSETLSNGEKDAQPSKTPGYTTGLSVPDEAAPSRTPNAPKAELATNDNGDRNGITPVRHANRPDSQRNFYASSDYSTQMSGGEEPMPAALPRQDPASYERLVMNLQVSRSHDQHTNQDRSALKGEPGLSQNSSSSSKAGKQRHHGTKRPKPRPSLHADHADSSSSDQRPRCKSCDAAVNPRKVQSKSLSPSHHKRISPGLSRSRRKSDAEARDRPQSLKRAVTGLENLMEEALTVARNAASAGRAEDIAVVLDQATSALREAGSVRSSTNGRPLRLSPQLSTYSSQSRKGDVSSNASSTSRGRVSSEALPTVITQNGSSRKSRFRELQDSCDIERATTSSTPPKLYTAPSADSIVRDFAYGQDKRRRRHSDSTVGPPLNYGAAASFYGDHGQSVAVQPGVRKSIAGYDKLITAPAPAPLRNARRSLGKEGRVVRAHLLQRSIQGGGLAGEERGIPLEELHSPAQLNDSPTRESPGQALAHENPFTDHAAVRDTRAEQADDDDSTPSSEISKPQPSKTHVSLKEGDTFNANRFHKHRPIAREWAMSRKRLTAWIACLNTIFTGFIAGIYAGEVPRIQYQLGDQSHWVIFGNTLYVVYYIHMDDIANM
ncbi:hypothetical protein PRZ48_004302 [Zasmidium cellare]|uniref:Uncharacterized protein n=1 Tax=Zasmidium cellare TaxID=395010 RepID=A0ABR0EP52_ZASCE|nr:hypothetical protein PRZ48_004302 [Zasmidium cellare]